MKINTAKRVSMSIVLTLMFASAILLAPSSPKPTATSKATAAKALPAPTLTAATILGNIIPTAECATIPCSQSKQLCDGVAGDEFVACMQDSTKSYTYCDNQYEATHNSCMEAFDCPPIFN